MDKTHDKIYMKMITLVEIPLHEITLVKGNGPHHNYVSSSGFGKYVQNSNEAITQEEKKAKDVEKKPN